MLEQLIIGSVLVVTTVLIHGVSLEVILKVVLRIPQHLEFRWRTLLFSLVVLSVFTAHVAEIWIWAIFFHFIEEFSNFEAALYFSTSSFTTVGYGDLVLSEEWRLMGALESANGMMLFGWSTAFIFEVVRRNYRRLYQVP
jgi:hypothetical protein